MKRPEASELANYKRGALVIAIMDPYGNDQALAALAKAGITAFAMELMPRITRAQSMDVLSSQANIAGYKAVMMAADKYQRFFPMLMTAAGTVKAARVVILGVGVATPILVGAGGRAGQSPALSVDQPIPADVIDKACKLQGVKTVKALSF